MPSPTFLGAIRSRGETLFRVWAPQARAVDVVFEEAQEPPLALKRDPDGYFTGTTSARSLYISIASTTPDRGPIHARAFSRKACTVLR